MFAIACAPSARASAATSSAGVSSIPATVVRPAEVVDDEPSALTGEEQGMFTTEATPRTGDDHDPSVE